MFGNLISVFIYFWISRGSEEGPQLENNKDESHSSSKLDIDLMVRNLSDF